jgi:acyl carrier protein
VLSQWHPQYLRLAHRIEHLLQHEGLPVFGWTSDIVYREDMARGLRAGLAAAVYVGHGRPVGWVGYYGTRIHHLQAEAGEALGVLLMLCCRTASRCRTSLSFAESVPLKGIAGAAFGAIGPTTHLDNTRWAVGLCAALGKGARTVGELIIQAMPTSPQAYKSYRLLGDPVAPIVAAASAIEQASVIPVFAWGAIIVPLRPEIMDLLSAELREMGVNLPDNLHDGLSFRQDLGLDSLAIAEFVARMELVFHVEISDLEWKELATIGLALDYVEKRLGKWMQSSRVSGQ